MSVTINLHRGADRIGGTITEIYTENTHIFVDFGSELSVPEEESTDADMVKMMQQAKCDGVLFTHYHGDHIGLMEKIPEKDVQGNPIRLYMGKTSRNILQNIHKTLLNNPVISDNERAEHEHMLYILRDDNRWGLLSDGASFEVGDFKITSVSVDHSAFDAYLFIIEAEGKCIVHTGDYRTHGRLGKGFFDRLEKALAGKNVDALITEGTMMSRLGEKVLSEEELQSKALDVLKKPENKWAFLICSSTNVESLASFANAAMYLGRAFYVNYYVYEQIKLYRETAGENNPALKFWKTYPFENMNKYNPKLGMKQPEFMKEKGFLMLIGASEAYRKRIECFKEQDPLLIYSMWGGYIKKDADTYDERLGALYHGWNPDRRVDLHTSGHATADDIRRMILAVKPQRHILPVHTEKPEMFEKLDIGEYAGKIKLLDNNGTLEV